tara:strand:+ start:433 stop:837 length:405 start_codon:yes stop_codon:yes gene_type:complete
MNITITQVRNAASLQSDNLIMDVEINHPQHGWIPYTVDPSDLDNSIDNSAILSLIGTNFAAYVAPTQEALYAALADSVRSERDRLLAQSDWTQTIDAAIDNQGQWQAYRTLLREIPQQTGFPSNINWPVGEESP